MGRLFVKKFIINNKVVEKDCFLVLVKSLSDTLKHFSSELLKISLPIFFRIKIVVFFHLISN